MATPTSFVPASELVASGMCRTAALPRDCTFTETDWRSLAPFWYPVAFSHEITNKPYAAHLLDEGQDATRNALLKPVPVRPIWRRPRPCRRRRWVEGEIVYAFPGSSSAAAPNPCRRCNTPCRRDRRRPRLSSRIKRRSDALRPRRREETVSASTASVMSASWLSQSTMYTRPTI
jgi:hypothetical protein